MVSIVSTAEFEVIYKQKALGGFFWKDHPCEHAVNNIKLTVSPVFQALLYADGNICVRLIGKPIASLSSATVSDEINQGPFIDIVGYSIKPTQKNIVCFNDSEGGTPVQKISFSRMDSNSLTAALLPNVNSRKDLEYGGTASLGFSKTTSTTQQISSNEFEQKELVKGRKRMLFYHMTKCYSGNIALPYDPMHVESIGRFKTSTVADVIFPFLPSGGFFPLKEIAHVVKKSLDEIYKPPSAATTSFGGTWSLEYSLQGKSSIEFEWITEVRTIFASVAPWYADRLGYGLNWLKTLHQIKQIIRITVSQDRKNIQLECLQNEDKIMRVVGYDSTVISTHQIQDDIEEEITIEELKDEVISII